LPSCCSKAQRRDRPDIHQRVLAGEITAHAGMVCLVVVHGRAAIGYSSAAEPLGTIVAW
jgi:hypothetical protein